MQILSHRGFWLEPKEKNQAVAFHRSFDQQFGTETDVRDRHEELVISHDMANDDAITLTDFLSILNGRDLPLAINIKADGLAEQLQKTMKKAKIENWFVFDMAIPDMRSYLRAGIPVYTRLSEVEQQAVWLQESVGVWLDAFVDIWYNTSYIETLLEKGKFVCVVSSELHHRPYESLWHILMPLKEHPSLMLCTDLPTKAKAFFTAT